ncbi:MAG: gamma-glutamyltransferase [Kiritimatiellae bacterium]|nr:gamma-glutamyltransferase [Kiritimatiellia bacterium]
MKSKFVCFFWILIFITVVLLPVYAEPVWGERGIVATVHPLATDAAINAFKRGGNAIDAAVVAALTLGVVDGHNSGIGGGCFMLIRLADGKFVAIDGREMAPAAATRDMFVRDGKADIKLSNTGPLAIATPGALAVYAAVTERYGRLTMQEHLLAAAEIAERGFTIDSKFAGRLNSFAPVFARFDGSRAMFLKSDGKPWVEGETFRQPDLARTYRAIAEHGIGWFYGGPFAKAVGDWMKKNGGILTSDDFRNYRFKFRDPITMNYRGFTVITFPPPSSGGVHVAQMLNILQSFDLKSLGHNSPDMIHVVIEAMKLAFADRAYWLGDPDFTNVPRGLVTPSYAKTLTARIRMDRASIVAGHGTPERAADDVFGKHTTHLSAADADGNWVACTTTINNTFGSKVVVPGTGVVLNDQMDDFSAQPGVPNAAKLIGAEANAIAPGKRPLSSMSPTIVLKNGQPVLAIGAAGGPTIISQTLLGLIGVLDFGLGVDAALASPRFHHQWSPDEVKIERTVDPAVRDELRRRSHKLTEVNSIGISQAVAFDPVTRRFSGAHDPRVSGKAAGW